MRNISFPIQRAAENCAVLIAKLIFNMLTGNMAVYPLAWIYYLSFIFFKAFAFLNMVIGVVVNILNEEHDKVRKKEDQDNHEISIENLDKKLRSLKALILQTHPPVKKA